MRFFARFLVGLIVSLLFMPIFVGHYENALAFIFLFVICTAGIGLVLVIPCCWAVGAIIDLILILCFGVGFTGKPNWGGRPVANLSPREREIAKYFRDARAHGMLDAAIIERLLGSGWTRAEIKSTQFKIDSR